MKPRTMMGKCHLKWLILAYIFIEFDRIGSATRIHRCRSWYMTNVRGLCRANCKPSVMSNDKEYDQVIEAMKKQNLQSIWLGLRRTWLGEFLWLDCTKPVGKFNRQLWNNLETNCAYFNIRDKQIDPGKCSYDTKGVLCQAEGCTSCSSLGLQASECVHINSTCYIKKSFKLSWEKAKIYCQNRTWVMAQFTGSTEDKLVQELSSRLYNSRGASNQEKFVWIGLRREEWLYSYPGLETTDVTVNHWAKDEPSDNKNCSVIERTSTGDYIWRAAACSSWHISLCISGEPFAKLTSAKPKNKLSTKPNIYLGSPSSTEDDNMSNIQRQMANQGNSEDFWTTLLVGVVTIIVMTTLFILFYVFVKRNIKQVGKRVYRHLSFQEHDNNIRRSPPQNASGERGPDEEHNNNMRRNCLQNVSEEREPDQDHNSNVSHSAPQNASVERGPDQENNNNRSRSSPQNASGERGPDQGEEQPFLDGDQERECETPV